MPNNRGASRGGRRRVRLHVGADCSLHDSNFVSLHFHHDHDLQLAAYAGRLIQISDFDSNRWNSSLPGCNDQYPAAQLRQSQHE